MSPDPTTAGERSHWTRLRRLLRNPISMAGIALSLVSSANILIFFVIDLLGKGASPYIGILAYMVAPGFLICGLVLMGFGAWRARRRKAAGLPEDLAPYPRIDLNDAAQRSAVMSFGTFLVVFVLVSSVGSYKAYEYTDSVQFCGLTCHTVMHPEYTAYKLSPHARVTCAQCHVGSGASWLRSSPPGLRRAPFAWRTAPETGRACAIPAAS